MKNSVKVTRVFIENPNGHNSDFLTNIEVKEALTLNPGILKDGRKVIGSREEVIEMNDNPNCKEWFENGVLKMMYTDSNPTDEELMEITPKDMAEMEENEEMVQFYESMEII